MQVDEDDITCDPRESFIEVHNHPLVVQGLKSSLSDPDAHVLLFDTEALIVQLLCDEFGISPSAMMENYRQSQGADSGSKPAGEFEQKINGRNLDSLEHDGLINGFPPFPTQSVKL